MARILVVDDAAFMRKMVSDALTKGGHEVVGEAGNGVEAVARFQELKPELTTLDITMPEKDGLAALKEIIAARPERPRDHVLRARPGVQGARVDQARRARTSSSSPSRPIACSRPSARRSPEQRVLLRLRTTMGAVGRRLSLKCHLSPTKTGAEPHYLKGGQTSSRFG